MQIHLENFDLAIYGRDLFKETEMIDGGHEFSSLAEPALVRDQAWSSRPAGSF